MASFRTTAGQLLCNAVLPRGLRNYDRVLGKKELADLLRQVALKYPERYRQISHDLANIGWQASYTTGGNSFGLRHLRQSPSARKHREVIQQALAKILDNDSLTDNERENQIVLLVGRVAKVQEKEVFDEQLAADNPLARQVLSGSRGNEMNLASLLASDLLYADHHRRVIPFPVLRSYSQGLTPAEYWAGAYGTRKGVIDLKVATQDAGWLSKQLNQVSHRNLVTAVDTETPSKTLRGFPVDVDDADNEGALIARGAGGYRRNTVLTPKILEDLRRQGIKRILIRSPIVGGAPDGGVYARDAGVREFGRLPVLGQNVALAAAQALSEPLTQAQISSKHTGGIATAAAGRAVSGFDYINQLVQIPKVFKGGAAHAQADGLVQRCDEAPAGGYNVTIGGLSHYVGAGYELKVKPGDRVEAGDVISEGTPNPAEIVKYKGIGEGRRYFVKAFRQAFSDAGLPAHRRNIELLAKGLINHVRLTEETSDHAPDDVVPYTRFAAGYEPREGFRSLAPKAAVGRYLERPYLHHTIGTRVRPSMLQDFTEFGVKRLDVHPDPPPFEFEMVRAMENLQHDPDWLTRMYGSGLRKSLLQATHRGAVSEPGGTSFVPGLVQATGFGQIGKVRTPKRADCKLSLEDLRERVKEVQAEKRSSELASTLEVG